MRTPSLRCSIAGAILVDMQGLLLHAIVHSADGGHDQARVDDASNP
jgi:hypothetical protein